MDFAADPRLFWPRAWGALHTAHATRHPTLLLACCAALQESREAAQRADPQNPDKLAAAGHTSTGQTLPQQAQAAREHADPEVWRL